MHISFSYIYSRFVILVFFFSVSNAANKTLKENGFCGKWNSFYKCFTCKNELFEKKMFYLYNFKQLKLSGNPNRLMMENWRMKFDLGVKRHLNLFLIRGIQISRSPSKWHTTVELYLLLFFLHGNHNVISNY